MTKSRPFKKKMESIPTWHRGANKNIAERQKTIHLSMQTERSFSILYIEIEGVIHLANGGKACPSAHPSNMHRIFT